LRLVYLNSYSAITFNTSAAPFTIDNPTTRVVAGTIKDGQCVFGTRLTHAVGAPQSAAIEIGYDPATCQFVQDVGTPTDINSSVIQGFTTSSVATPATNGTGVGSLQEGWSDPLNVNLTWEKENMTWDYSGSTVDYEGGYSSDYTSDDGWQRISNSDYNGYNSSKAWQGSRAEFENSIFPSLPGCTGSGPTYTWYWPIELDGFAGGSDSAYVNTYSQGTCSNIIYSWQILN